MYNATYTLILPLFIYIFAESFLTLPKLVLYALIICASCLPFTFIYLFSLEFKAREKIEHLIKIILYIASLISIVITLAIIASILFEALKFFHLVSPFSFLFGTNWMPEDYTTDYYSHNFGVIPVLTGSLLITMVAMATALPIGLFAAIFLAEYTEDNVRLLMKPILEMLAGIPTVVYGYFAAIFVGPFIRDIGIFLNLNIASESALSAGLVMGIMITPLIFTLSEDAISSVSQNLRDASFALGATSSETIVRVVLPAAFPGIMSAILLGTSRAVGETMIVTMAAGLTANLTLNPLKAVTTVTAQIVSLLGGDQEFSSAKTLSAFALALTLFIITLILNLVALIIIKRYREKYE
jgi:phosphate transport system permease protein